MKATFPSVVVRPPSDRSPRGLEAIVGAQRVERSGGRIELSDRRRREELIGVQFAHGFTAGQIDDENSPMRRLVFGRMNDRPDLAFEPLASGNVCNSEGWQQ